MLLQRRLRNLQRLPKERDMTLRFACCDVGVTDCRGVIEAESKDELLSAVAKHAQQKHGVKLNETLVSFALTKVTER